MKWLVLAVGVGAASALPAAQVPSLESLEGQEIAIRGCVRAGIERDTFVLNRITEVQGQGRVLALRQQLVRPVIYWLDDVKGLRGRVGRMVEVSGEIDDVNESEVDFQEGPDRLGGLIVELEGPGRDVRTTPDVVREVVGTAGGASRPDVQTIVLKIDVRSVRVVDGTCR